MCMHMRRHYLFFSVLICLTISNRLHKCFQIQFQWSICCLVQHIIFSKSGIDLVKSPHHLDFEHPSATSFLWANQALLPCSCPFPVSESPCLLNRIKRQGIIMIIATRYRDVLCQTLHMHFLKQASRQPMAEVLLSPCEARYYMLSLFKTGKPG